MEGLLTYSVLLLFVIGGILVVYGTIVKNRWGLNLKAITCPNCGAPMPRVRAPSSLNEGLWGGSTCPKCGTKVDKWGRKIEPGPA